MQRQRKSTVRSEDYIQELTTAVIRKYQNSGPKSKPKKVPPNNGLGGSGPEHVHGVGDVNVKVGGKKRPGGMGGFNENAGSGVGSGSGSGVWGVSFSSVVGGGGGGGASSVAC